MLAELDRGMDNRMDRDGRPAVTQRFAEEKPKLRPFEARIAVDEVGEGREGGAGHADKSYADSQTMPT